MPVLKVIAQCRFMALSNNVQRYLTLYKKYFNFPLDRYLMKFVLLIISRSYQTQADKPTP